MSVFPSGVEAMISATWPGTSNVATRSNDRTGLLNECSVVASGVVFGRKAVMSTTLRVIDHDREVEGLICENTVSSTSKTQVSRFEPRWLVGTLLCHRRHCSQERGSAAALCSDGTAIDRSAQVLRDGYGMVKKCRNGEKLGRTLRDRSARYGQCRAGVPKNSWVFDGKRTKKPDCRQTGNGGAEEGKGRETNRSLAALKDLC